MKVAVLFSGGKDSCLVLHKARKFHEVACLVSLISKNPESYMFHVPNIELTKKQAEAIGLPLIEKITPGKKEEELKELKEAIEEAKKKYKIEGVVTGAIKSNYQASRIANICKELKLLCINPLWQKNPETYWKEILEDGFEVIISSVSCEGLDKEWLGKKIDKESLNKLKMLSKKFQFHLGFEGGEAETFTIDGPIFKKKIRITEANTKWDGKTGQYLIKKTRLINK